MKNNILMDKKLYFLVGVIACLLPSAVAEITEIETNCGLFECETILETDFVIPPGLVNENFPIDVVEKVSNYEGITFRLNLLDQYNYLNNIDIEILDLHTIKVSGKIRGASNNYWGISVGDDYTFWNSTWWNSTWDKRQAVEMSVASGSTIANYQVGLNVTYDANMNSDFSDLRFSNSTDDGLIDYWIEQKDNGAWAYVWVEIPDSINTTVRNMTYMYYGNGLATTLTNCENTMLFCDNFTVNSEGSKWFEPTSSVAELSIAGGVASLSANASAGYVRSSAVTEEDTATEYRARRTGGTYIHGVGVRSQDTDQNQYTDSGTYHIGVWEDGAGACDMYKNTNGVGGSINTPCSSEVFTITNWNYYKMEAEDDTFTFYHSTNNKSSWYQVHSGSQTGFRNSSFLHFNINPSTSVYEFDDVFVRRFRTPEPTTSFDQEETFTTTTPPAITTTTIIPPINQYDFYNCSEDGDYLIRNLTTWDGLQYDQNITAEFCEYGCDESLLGVGCKYSPAVQDTILFIVLLGALGGAVALFTLGKKLLG
jgi:hypothetical protein